MCRVSKIVGGRFQLVGRDIAGARYNGDQYRLVIGRPQLDILHAIDIAERLVDHLSAAHTSNAANFQSDLGHFGRDLVRDGLEGRRLHLCLGLG